jgi:hypothetical protein
MADALEGGGDARLLVGRPVAAEDLLREILGRRRRVVQQALAGFRQRDEREARISGMRLPRDEADPLERAELPGDAGRRHRQPREQEVPVLCGLS